jgi:hypothetical protein
LTSQKRDQKLIDPGFDVRFSYIAIPNILVKLRFLSLINLFPYTLSTGLQQSFWHGIYSPSIGFTLAFGDTSKELVALSGIFMSFGAVLGKFLAEHVCLIPENHLGVP